MFFSLSGVLLFILTAPVSSIKESATTTLSTQEKAEADGPVLQSQATTTRLNVEPSNRSDNIFAEMDENKDNKVSFAEFVAWHELKLGSPQLPEGLWDLEDKNKDGFIDWDEFLGPKGSPPSSKEEL